MAKTFADLVAEGRAVAPMITVDDTKTQLEAHPETLIIDVRQEEDAHGHAIPGSINIPLGLLPLRADTQLPENYRDARLQDRNTPIITTCGRGGQASLAAKTLHDMGFTNVKIMDGGTTAWIEAGNPTH